MYCVYVTPTIIIQPSDVLAVVNGNLTLVCEAEAFPPPQYLWEHIEGNLTGRSNVMGINSKKLELNGVIFGDEGSYICKVISNNITVASEIATVTLSPSTGVTVTPSSTTVAVNVTVFLNCSGLGGPGNIYQWSTGHITPTLELIVTNGTSDGGTYTCVVTNAAGSGSASATVYVTPTIITQPSDVLAVVNDNVTLMLSPSTGVTVTPSSTTVAANVTVILTCFSLGGPGNTYRWSTGHITPTIKLIVKNGTSDGGTYTCVVTNAAGSGSASATVVSIDWSNIVTPSSTTVAECHCLFDCSVDVLAVVNDNVTLVCEAEAFPPPQYLWEHIGGNLTGRSNVMGINRKKLELMEYCLEMKEATYASDFLLPCLLTTVPSGAPGNVAAITIAPTSINVSWNQVPNNCIIIAYEVKYSWPLGNGQLGTIYVNTSVYAQVPQPPEVLTSALTATSANLTWSCPLEKHYTVLSYSVNVTVEDASSINTDFPFTSYSFEVLVNTMEGNGAVSMPRLFTTLQAPPTSPLNISTSVISYSSVLVSWSPPTCSNGIVLGYMQNLTAKNIVNVSTQLQDVVSQATQLVDQSASNLAVVTTVITQISNVTLSSPDVPVSNNNVQLFEEIAHQFVQQDTLQIWILHTIEQELLLKRRWYFLTVYKTASLFPIVDSSGGVEVSPLVIGVTVATEEQITNLTDPVVLNFSIPITKIRQKDVSKYHIQLCCALIGMLLVFVIGIDRTERFGGCVTVSVLIHYFTLAAVMWMGAEALFMFQKIVLVFFQATTRYFVVLSIICWAFLGPILLVLLFNMIVFIAVIVVVLVRHQWRRSKEHKRKFGTLQLMINVTSIAFLFGLTWIFGALTVVRANQAFQIVFTLTNSFQGFLIFIFFCVLNSEVRFVWAHKLLGKHLPSKSSTTGKHEKRHDQYRSDQSESVISRHKVT
eukprot:Em0001g3775a